MNEPTQPTPKPCKPALTPEELARSRMNRPYPRRFFTSAEAQDMLRALEAEQVRNPAFGPTDLAAFLDRYRASRPAHYRLADGTVVTFMPDEPSRA